MLLSLKRLLTGSLVTMAMFENFSAGIRPLTTMSASALSPKVSLGAGCYWGTEKFVIKDFNKDLVPGSIKEGKVGFMNPDANAKPNPSYREVCTGTTGYVEVYDCELTPEKTDADTFEKLLKHFFSFHDPTTINRQGNDRGTQYASAIFCYDEEQMKIAEKVKAEIQELIKSKQITNYNGPEVTTAILPATNFYAAQEDHQAYLENNPGGYCNHAYRFKWNWSEEN